MTQPHACGVFRCITVGIAVVLAGSMGAIASHAQTFRIESTALSTLGGAMTGGSFSLQSSAGETVPAGHTRGGAFSIRSGFIATVSVDAGRLVVEHTPLTQPVSIGTVEIKADVLATRGVASATLFYQMGGEEAFESTPMTAEEGRYVAAIPANAVTSRGVSYYISVSDQKGKIERVPRKGVYAIRVAVPDGSVSASLPLPAGEAQTNYRLISVPLMLNERHVGAVLADDFGAYDSTKWRLFELTPSQTVNELPGTGELLPGEGYWLIAREGGRTLDLGAGTTADHSQPFPIPLHPGWNLIGTPFNFAIPSANIRLENGEPLTLRSFNGSWNDPQQPVTAMQPFVGYAVYSEKATRLLIDPNRETSKKEANALKVASEPAWAIRITAESKGARDIDNIAGVAASAEVGRDAHDQPEPPVIGEYVSVYFTHPEWETITSHYAVDVRAEPEQGEVWNFQVRANTNSPTHLQFEGLERVPDAYQVWLVDELLQYTQDLRMDSRYTVGRMYADKPRSFQLIVGSASFIDTQLESIRELPEDYEVFPNFPNPFASTTTIRYGLPEDATVSLKAYDVLGKEVATLVHGEDLEAGVHVLVWDGRGTNGQPLASGMYFLRLVANGRVATRSIIIVR